MVDPNYMLRISEGAEDIADQLRMDIIIRIIDRMMARIGRGEKYLLTATDKWNIEVLQDAGYILADIQQDIAKRTKLQQEEIAAAMIDAGVKTLAYDDKVYEKAGLTPTPLRQSPDMMRTIQRNYDATMGEWRNFTRTTAQASQNVFIRAMDKAHIQVTSGAVSYSQAVSEAIDDVIKKAGTVTYENAETGKRHVDTLETATLRAVRTGIAQSSITISLKRMEEMDWDIILVSSHLGARVTKKNDYTNHYWWQGQFYSRTGRNPEYPPFSVCGWGDVQGIGGANCRHTISAATGNYNPFEQYNAEENRKAYELSQQQRAMELAIRKTKREAMSWKEAVDKAENEAIKAKSEQRYQKVAEKLSRQNKEYNDFCAQNNLSRRTDRIKVARWDRRQAASAISAAKKYENTV